MHLMLTWTKSSGHAQTRWELRWLDAEAGRAMERRGGRLPGLELRPSGVAAAAELATDGRGRASYGEIGIVAGSAHLVRIASAPSARVTSLQVAEALHS